VWGRDQLQQTAGLYTFSQELQLIVSLSMLKVTEVRKNRNHRKTRYDQRLTSKNKIYKNKNRKTQLKLKNLIF
jgi:hypothetical protein